MRKFFTSILLVQVVFCLYVNAQTTDVLRNELDAIFQYVDKSQVPTGYLEEFGPGFVPMHSFNGLLTDSNRFNFDSWQLIYGQIRASKIYGITALPTLTTAINNVKTAGNHPANIFAVPLLLMDYSVLYPYAVQQNLFTVSNDQIFDVANRTQSPYQQKLLFGATPAVNYTNNGTVQVLFKPDLFYTNTGKTISNIHVDFNDHNGYVPIALNVPFTKTYTDTGYKSWKIKLTCIDNSVYECYTDFQVTAIAATNNVPARYGDNPDILEQSFNAVPGPGPWAHSGGKVTVWYSRKLTERTLNKPFIILEGYDASRVAPSLKKPLDYLELLALLRDQPVGYNFTGYLDDIAGYDLVFLDFNNGTDDMLRNVALFKEVLGWVNQTKAGNPNPQANVVLGLSMGGLVTRYALADLTKQNIPTGTRLLISHDSPHQGANTPLGLQYMTRFLATSGGIGGFILNELDMVREGNNLLNEPASEQLLIYKATSPTTYTANTFLAGTYRNMITFGPNDPIPTYKFIAVASGSECGVPLFAAGSDIVNIQAGVLLPIFVFSGVLLKFEAIVKALPASGSPTNIAHLKIYRTISLFFGAIQKVKILSEFNAFSPAGALPWDGAPGGTVDVAEKLKVKPFKIIIPLGIGLTGAGFFVQEKICFVPNTSSLDITNVNSTALTASYVGGISPGNPSRAINFKAQEQFSVAGGGTTYNTGHRFFTAKNANWLFNEMENITPNDLNCSQNCQPGFSISGDDNPICTSKTYSFQQLPANGTINWTVTPSGIATFVVNADKTVTVTKQQNGIISLTGTTTFCNQTFTASKQITVGTPIDGSFDMEFLEKRTYPSPVTPGNAYFAGSVSTVTGALRYDWYVNNIFVRSVYPNSTYTEFELGRCNKWYTVKAIAITPCGNIQTAAPEGRIYASCTSGMFMVNTSPNPTSDNMNISIETEAMLQAGYNNPAWMQITEVKIYDKFGILKKRKQYAAGTQNIVLPVNDLPSDVYNMHITNGVHHVIKQIIIQR